MRRWRRGSGSLTGLLLLGLLLVACGPGDGAAAQRGDDPGGAPESAPPTWSGEIASLVEARCLPCHAEEGEAPLAFGTYADARRRASLMLEAIDTGFMPPWLAVQETGSFRGERFLEPGERDLFARWVETGAAEGRPGRVLPVAAARSWALGTPDAVLTMQEPFVIPAGGADVKRGFALQHEFPSSRYLRAVDIRFPGGRGAHHCKLYLDRSGAADEMVDGSNTSFVVMHLLQAAEKRQGTADLLTGWFPGVDPTVFPEGASVRMEPGDRLVLDLHGVPSGVEQRLQPEVAVYFSEEPPTEEFLVFHFALGLLNIAPEARQTYRRAIELPVDLELIGLVPHAHFLCDEVRVRAQVPGGELETLLRIDAWNFDFQFIYTLREPRRLPRGTRVELEMTYDNTSANLANPEDPPRRVLLGPDDDNEMGVLFLQATVASRRENDALRAAVDVWDADPSQDQKTAALFTGLTQGFDADEDGTLDAEEDAAATSFLRAAVERAAWVESAGITPGEASRILELWERGLAGGTLDSPAADASASEAGSRRP